MYRLLLLILFFVTLAQSENIHWLYNYDYGHKIAKEQNKPILLFVRDETKEETNQLLETTFKEHSLVKLVKDHFIAIQIENGIDNYPLEMFYTLHTPAIFFVNENEIFLHETIIGFIHHKELKNIIETILK